MSNQYIYGQPMYQQKNFQYQRQINPASNQMRMQGAQFATYGTTNYQQMGTGNILQQTYEQAQPGIYGQKAYTQQVYYQGQQPGSKQIYDEYQQGQGDQNVGFENYYEIQPPQQQMINPGFPQLNSLAGQQATRIAQQKAKITRQIVQNQNYQQQYQPSPASRNPYIRQQFQQQQQQQQYNQGKIINPHFVHGKATQEKEEEGDEKTQIESDFQPEIPIANSVLNQSKIPFEQNKPQMNPNLQPSYVLPKRNPNMNVKKYGYTNNDSHFVNCMDPGTRTIGMGVGNTSNMSIAQIEAQKSKLITKRSKELEYQKKNSNLSKNSLDENLMKKQSGLLNEQPEVGMGNNDINMIESTAVNNGLNTLESKNNENIFETKYPNEEANKENPMEEKFPEESNANLNNENDNFPQEMNQNQLKESEIGDIDDNLDHLPTINSIMKGNSDMLPPPKKKKYK